MLTAKVLELQKPLFLRYTWAVMGQGTYIRGLYEDRAHTVDEVMKTYVRVGARLLKTEAGSRSSFYGLRSAIGTLVWLHCYLNGYSCLIIW